MMMQQPMVQPMMAAPMMAAPQPQVQVINTNAQQAQQQVGGYNKMNLQAEMAKIQPHELNSVGKRNAADRLRGLIAQEQAQFNSVKAQHDAEIYAANEMCKQLEPEECCTIC